MKPEEKIERAYEELRAIIDGGSESFTHDDAVQYLKDVLAKKEQSWPVAIYQYQMGDGSWIDQEKHSYDYNKLHAPNAILRVVYTTPQQRTWVGLDWSDLPDEWVGNLFFKQGARWAEAKLKEKNT